MKIKLTSIMVDDQDKALEFYTTKLGFIKKTDVPLGKYKWLTVVNEDAPDGTEILLEPMEFAPAKVFQKALYDAGIPLTAFLSEQLEEEYEKLVGMGVDFTMKPTAMGTVKIAVFKDGCGNLIQLFQPL